MQCKEKPPVITRRFYTSPRALLILGFVFINLISLTAFAPQASAAVLSAPGGNVADPVVRQVDIVGIAAMTGDETMILEAPDRLAHSKLSHATALPLASSQGCVR